jgi:hypothetical protein
MLDTLKMLNVRGWWKWFQKPSILGWLLVPVIFSLRPLTKDYPVAMTLLASGLVVLAFADFLRRPDQPLRVPLNVAATILILAAFCLVLAAIYLFFFPVAAIF